MLERSRWEKVRALCGSDAVTITPQNCLKAARDGRLAAFINRQYPMDHRRPEWIDYLQLCQDLVEAGYLKAKFEEDTTPGKLAFINDDARITIAGREYLYQLEQRTFWRRFGKSALIFLSGIGSSFLVQWLKLWTDYYAKTHGLQ